MAFGVSPENRDIGVESQFLAFPASPKITSAMALVCVKRNNRSLSAAFRAVPAHAASSGSPTVRSDFS
jgi:hypothetical protein